MRNVNNNKKIKKEEQLAEISVFIRDIWQKSAQISQKI